MNALEYWTARRNSLELYIQALFSPYLIAGPFNDSIRVSFKALWLSRPSKIPWGIYFN